MKLLKSKLELLSEQFHGKPVSDQRHASPAGNFTLEKEHSLLNVRGWLNGKTLCRAAHLTNPMTGLSRVKGP